MLTGDLVRPCLHKHAGELRVKLLDAADGRAQRTAAALIALFRQQVGRSFGDWEEALAHYEGDRTDYVAVRGLAKVLADSATYVACETPRPPAEIGRRSLPAARRLCHRRSAHPSTRADLLAETASELGLFSRTGGGIPLRRPPC